MKYLKFLLLIPLAFMLAGSVTNQMLQVVARKNVPDEYMTDLKVWPDDNRWVYKLVDQLPAEYSYAPKLHIVSGTGWTPGAYTISSTSPGYATGYDGNKDMVYLASSPAAAGTTGGVGYLTGGYGDNNIVFEGNSLTSGIGASGASTYYPWQTILLLGEDWKHTNVGESAETTQDCEDDYAADIAPLYSTEFTDNILVIWEISNDLFFEATTTEAMDNIEDLGDLGQATGYTVIVLSVLPRDDVGKPAGWDADRATVNAALRSDFDQSTANSRVFLPGAGGTYADMFVDVAANTTIGDDGDETNGKYYDADKVHMTDTGYGLIATDVDAGIALLP